MGTAASKFVLIVLFVSTYAYLVTQLVWPAHLTPNETILGLLGIGFPFVLAILQPLLFWGKERIAESLFVQRLQIAGYLSLNIVSDWLVLTLLRDLLRFTCFLFSWDSTYFWSEQSGTLIALSPFITLTCGALTIYFFQQIRFITISDERIPASFHGYKILQMSDVHISPVLPMNLLKRYVRNANEQNPDMTVITGDIGDCDYDLYTDRFLPLKDLRAKDGVFACLGNHDYYWNLKSTLAHFPQLGMNLLINQSAEIKRGEEKIRISGIPDPISRFFQADVPAWEKIKPLGLPNVFEVLLSHRPKLVHKANEEGFHLQLSGHTHGGQFFPWNFIIIFFERLSKGYYKIKNTHLYVNPGTGFWGPPNRFGSPSEITVLTLQRREKKA